jgi:hypothetical protein
MVNFPKIKMNPDPIISAGFKLPDLNPEAEEFCFSPGDSMWNASAQTFIPFTEPVPQPEPAAQTSPKRYSLEFMLSLKPLHLNLPPNVLIPETYSKNYKPKGKKGKPAAQNTASSLKRAENQLNSLQILVKTEKPMMEKLKREADELEKKSREIRSILNKLSERNFEKLCAELTAFEYSKELLASLTRFIFERATAMNFAELYSKLCSSLRQSFKAKGLSTAFRKSIVEKCRECFYNEDVPSEDTKLMEAEFRRRRKLIGNIKFIALLHKIHMIKSEIMFECFNVLLEPKTLGDETLETCVTLFKDTCSSLIGQNRDEVNGFYEKIVALRGDPSICKRVGFMIQDLIEAKDVIMVPSGRKNSKKKHAKITEKSSGDEERKVVARISDDLKRDIQESARGYVQHFAEGEWKDGLAKIFKGNMKMAGEIVLQTMKYGLYEYFKAEKVEAVCEMVKFMLENYAINKGAVGQAFRVIEEDLHEIRLDNPCAEEMLGVMKAAFKEQESE